MDRELNSVWNLAEPLALSMGYELLKVESAVEHGGKVLRVYLDKAGGIVLEDCESFSHALGPVLDVEANVEGRYHLEVSSPGLDRPLSKLAHFSAQLGNIVQVTTEEPIEGRRKFKGELLKAEGEGEASAIEIQVDQDLFRIELDRIKKANLDYFASEAKRLKADSDRGRKKGRKA
ncbi:MAG: ribosome maturation factor RimP [Deltaproteobacteria bacterium]|nr:ribosome maturation factor RimP [Deltaproteobacteria bacterium]